MSVRKRAFFAVAAMLAALAAAGAAGRVFADGGERSLTIYNTHTKETVTAVFKRGGRYVPAGLERLNHIMRDHRQDKPTRMDPELMDLLWEMHRELGSSEPIHLISGYRAPETNAMLRRTTGGQAKNSRHVLGKAADVHFPDVPVKRLRYSALVQERGGVGYYPTSAIPFVHVDTDRVRSWPRLPRHELALLFPSGRTEHAPASGGPLRAADVSEARSSHRDLARQIAQFHANRSSGRRVAIAEARPEPALLEAPRAVEAPPRLRLARSPSDSDRAGLTRLASLASLAPQLVAAPVLVHRPPRVAMAALALPDLPVPSLSVPSALWQPAALPPGIGPGAALGEQAAPRGPAESMAGLAPSGQGRFGWGDWLAAPAYDEEHPEELSYRPFPIAPFLTATPDEPLMHEFAVHAPARTVEMLDQLEAGPILRFRPSARPPSPLWSRQFTGKAIAIDKLRAAKAVATEPMPGMPDRPVRTSQR